MRIKDKILTFSVIYEFYFREKPDPELLRYHVMGSEGTTLKRVAVVAYLDYFLIRSVIT